VLHKLLCHSVPFACVRNHFQLISHFLKSKTEAQNIIYQVKKNILYEPWLNYRLDETCEQQKLKYINFPNFTLPCITGVRSETQKRSFAFFCSSANLNKYFIKTEHLQANRRFLTILGKSLYLSKSHKNKIAQKILNLSLLKPSLN